MNWQMCGRIIQWPILKYYNSKETRQDLSAESWITVQDFNPISPKFKGVLKHTPSHSVNDRRRTITLI